MEQKNQHAKELHAKTGTVDADNSNVKDSKVAEGKMIAVIRIRGINEIKTVIEDTMQMLRLYRKNFCVVVSDDPIKVGMLRKAKDYITWGELDDETYKMLIEKRGEEFTGSENDSKNKIKYNDFMIINGKKMKKYFRLNAPRKGYGRKGIKNTFNKGGALGYRGPAINELIKRML